MAPTFEVMGLDGLLGIELDLVHVVICLAHKGVPTVENHLQTSTNS